VLARESATEKSSPEGKFSIERRAIREVRRGRGIEMLRIRHFSGAAFAAHALA